MKNIKLYRNKCKNHYEHLYGYGLKIGSISPCFLKRFSLTVKDCIVWKISNCMEINVKITMKICMDLDWKLDLFPHVFLKDFFRFCICFRLILNWNFDAWKWINQLSESLNWLSDCQNHLNHCSKMYFQWYDNEIYKNVRKYMTKITMDQKALICVDLDWNLDVYKKRYNNEGSYLKNGL